ncbi:MAG: flagellar motor switch protein FliM, partial [Stellaceae bacterium]
DLSDPAPPPNPEPGANVRAFNLFVQDEAAPARLPTLDVVNDRFSRSLRVALVHHLRKSVQIDAGTVALVKHFELIERLSQPTYMVLVGLKPLRGTMLIAIDAPLVVATVESRFGGNGRFPVTKTQRDFTTVEQKVMSRMVAIILDQFAGAWRRIAELQAEILRQEFNPQFAGITASNEPVIVTTFQIKVDNGEGTLTIAIPVAMLAPIQERMTSAVAAENAEPDSHWFEQIKSGVEQVVMPLRVELAEVEMSVHDLLELSPGDVFEIERPQSVVIEAEGVPLFRGRWGRFGAKSAVRIDGAVAPDESQPKKLNGRSSTHG